jgi:hypothetical protein
MTSMKRLAGGVAFVALACAVSSAAYAQEITGAVVGTVTDSAGAPVNNAKVRVTNVSNGASLNATTNGQGFFTIRNLAVGGPYQVVVTGADGASKSVQVPSIGIGQPYSLNVTLPSAGTVQELVVTAAKPIGASTVQTGPRSTFTAADIQTAPTFGRDLKDLTRMNPLVTIDPTSSNAVIVAGANSHLNTIYVDGVRQSDDFGLNNSGYPTQRSPFSIDIVQAFNFEVAPYDVRYGNFQGGIMNVVTKSGTNDFHGGAFYEQDSDRLAGNRIGSQALMQQFGSRLITTKFKDQNYGGTLGGPIIKDTLFFFGGYEKYKGVGGAGGFVPGDVDGANPIPTVTSANVTQVQSILKSSYNYDPLNYGGQGPVVDEKYFGKLDWFISDKHHLFVSYQQTKGTTYNIPNGSVSNKIVNLASNDYIYEQDLTAYTADLVSHWTQNLTTEIEYTKKEVKSPSTLQTGPFAEFIVQLPSTGSIYLGPDISRQANNLGNTDQQYKARADYTWGNHVLSAGYEHEELSSFDLFVQNATGAYTFSSGCGLGDTLLNLQAHIACRFTYQNAFDNNPQTAAGTVVSDTDTLFLQDEWRLTPELTVRAGLRYERYSTDDVPLLNPRFLQQYGYANTATIDGEDILMPRIGFNWQPDPTLVITGGFGLFSGGNPGVYTYNSYQNTGNILGTRTYTCSAMGATACNPVLLNVNGATIPAQAQADITTSAALGTGNANALDPNFKPPSVWKATLSAVKTVNLTDYGFLGRPGEVLGDNWRVHGDLYYSKVKEAVLFQDIWAMQNVIGTAPDGRPMFNPARYTNNLNRTSGSDILLTNTDKGDAKIFAVGFGKDWDWGFGFDYTYTHQRVRDVSAATSSVATSNYNNLITADPNHPDLATSNNQIKYEHRLTLNFEHEFFGDNKTILKVFGYERAGLPFSYAFCTTSSSSCTSPTFSGTYDQMFGQSSTSTNHQLLYVPAGTNGVVTATSDPLVKFAPGFDLAAFNTFLQSSGLAKYEGQIAPRNAFKSRDVSQFDLHLSQEFPAFFPGHAKGEVYMDIINLGNLINRNWGVINQAGFPYVLAPVVARNCKMPGVTCAAGPGNYYQYDSFKASNLATQVQIPTSPPVPTWIIKLGMRYKF